MNAHLTSHDNIVYEPIEHKARDARIGRASFEQILQKSPSDTHVYFCGSPIIQTKVAEICQQRNLVLHRGHSFHSK